MSSSIKGLFTGDSARHAGVPPINVYGMRVVYLLMAVFLGRDSWGHILAHQGPWESFDAMGWCVWAAFASLAVLGLFHTVRMVPLLLFEVFYKVLWLGLVAYPLWAAGTLDGSSAEGMTSAFLWIALPIAVVPWPWVVRTFLLGRPPTPVSLDRSA